MKNILIIILTFVCNLSYSQNFTEIETHLLNVINEEIEDQQDLEDGLNGMVGLEDNLRETDINYENIEKQKEFNLKTRNEIYYDLWNDARKKVREARDNAIKVYLDAKDIKSTYLLDDLYQPSEFEEYLEKMTTQSK